VANLRVARDLARVDYVGLLGVVSRPVSCMLLGAVASGALACSSQLAQGQSRARPSVSGAAQPGLEPEEGVPVPTTPELAAAAPSDHPATVSGPPSAAIEDASGRALTAFHAALRRAQAGQGQARIVFYGASHVASDQFTGVIRQRLQHRFGEAGPGFVPIGRPWRWFRHSAITVDESRSLRTFRIKARAPEDGIYGLAGVALDALRGKPARAAITLRANGRLTGHASRFELYYLKQPQGGRISLFVDGKRERNLDTEGEHAAAAYAAIEMRDGLHHIELRTSGDGPVRVFGAALERDTSGVILDTLGIPGARARDHLHWEDSIYREHLARRRPDLIVLAYGTNESGDDDVPIDVYDKRLHRVLARVREVAPEASCLLVGPSDRPLRNDDGSFVDRPLTSAIIASQRRIAPEYGCGFFDIRRFMGGPMSMLAWVAAQPPLGSADHVHFTQLGYERLADVLHSQLLAGFEQPALDAEPKDDAIAVTPSVHTNAALSKPPPARSPRAGAVQELPRAVR
jgi:lysophospholipase L1-like esterase